MLENKDTRRGFLAKTLAAIGALALGGLSKAQSKAKWNETMQLAIDYTIDIAGRYRRPYTAVWIENAAGENIRTLTLSANTGRGFRYIEHLTRWVRDLTAAQNTTNYVMSVSSPTREPGKFSLVWDGKDDKKALVDQGDYYVCVESAREDGPYGLVRQKYTFGADAFIKKLSGDGDIKEVNLSYGKAK